MRKHKYNLKADDHWPIFVYTNGKWNKQGLLVEVLPEVCTKNWPCVCEHRHGRYRRKHDPEINGKLYGYCRFKGCPCQWYEPMDHFEYVAWVHKQRHPKKKK